METDGKMKDYSKLYKDMAAKSIDKYNSPENTDYDPNLYKRIIHSNNQYAPSGGETPETYLIRLKVLQELSSSKNTRTHVETARGRPWYTYQSPLGCFMCEDQQFISVTISIIEYLFKKYPKLSFT